jgi:N6-adenosine-specific RNA methylase IME4
MAFAFLLQSLQRSNFSIIYADPPWTFQTWSKRGKARSAESHYPCLTLPEIQALPIADIAADNCTLFLWATDPLLPQAIDLIQKWGFNYKTIGFNWVKLNKSSEGFFTGMGYWTRANAELCLLGTRGKPKRKSASVRRLVVAPRREHSRKPDVVADRIVDLMGDLPRIELFARTPRPGWEVWGNETNKWEPNVSRDLEQERKGGMG